MGVGEDGVNYALPSIEYRLINTYYHTSRIPHQLMSHMGSWVTMTARSVGDMRCSARDAKYWYCSMSAVGEGVNIGKDMMSNTNQFYYKYYYYCNNCIIYILIKQGHIDES